MSTFVVKLSTFLLKPRLKMLAFIYVILPLILPLNASYAQVNTEKYRDLVDKDGLHSNLELSGIIKTGNSEQIVVDVNGRLNYRHGNYSHFFILENEYEWINDSRVINEQLLHARTIYTFEKTYGVEIFGQINLDKKLRISNRELIGAGARIMIGFTDKYLFYIGSAYMFEHENYDLPPTSVHPKSVRVSRWSNYISQHLKLSNTLSFSGVGYYQPMITDFTDYRVLIESSLESNITKNISLVITVNYRYDSKPADEVKNADTKTRIGMVFKI